MQQLQERRLSFGRVVTRWISSVWCGFLGVFFYFHLHQLPVASAIDCTTLSSCQQCYNASSWCHWCSDTGLEENADRKARMLDMISGRKTARRGDEMNVVSDEIGTAAATRIIPGPKERSGPGAGGQCRTRGTGCLSGASCGDDHTNSTCAAQHDCQSCTNVSSLCHWCGDSCHVLGSMYGCTVGVSCMANTECKRKQPEYVGFGSAPDFVYFLTFGILLLFALMALCTQCICYRVYKSVQQAREEIEQSYELQNHASTEEEESLNYAEAARRAAERRPALWARIVDRFVSGCFKNSCFCCALLFPVLFLTGTVFVLHYPQMPIINYCSKELEWGKLIENVETVITEQVYADFEFLLSVYNPNKVEVTIEEMKGSLYYPPTSSSSNNLIGTVNLKNFTASAGSVSDGLAVVSLAVERWSALNLAKEYALGNLKILAKGEIVFSLKIYGFQMVQTMTAAVPDQVIDTAAPLDMTYCNCRDGPPHHLVRPLVQQLPIKQITTAVENDRIEVTTSKESAAQKPEAGQQKSDMQQPKEHEDQKLQVVDMKRSASSQRYHTPAESTGSSDKNGEEKKGGDPSGATARPQPPAVDVGSSTSTSSAAKAIKNGDSDNHNAAEDDVHYA
ncbi:unnamed protein product [Amoebophrya sp. A120]|nr:unnamed protein product [Amoebophrya sp. A120]|eukprot:GSA120T00020982001.1